MLSLSLHRAEVFKVGLDYWNRFVPDIYTSVQQHSLQVGKLYTGSGTGAFRQHWCPMCSICCSYPNWGPGSFVTNICSVQLL